MLDTFLEVIGPSAQGDFSVRCVCRLSKGLVAGLKQLLFDKKEEKGTLVLALDKARQELPACIALLRTMTEATAVAAQLNAPIPVNADDDDDD